MAANEMEQVFTEAIEREMEAYEFYKKVAERVSDSNVKEIFMDLAKEEKGHEELLFKLKADPSMTFTVDDTEDFKIAESVETAALTVDMKPADAIAVAMKKEQHAAEFYKRLAEASKDERFKEIYMNLSKMELQHKNRLENLYIDVGYPEAWG